MIKLLKPIILIIPILFIVNSCCTKHHFIDYEDNFDLEVEESNDAFNAANHTLWNK